MYKREGVLWAAPAGFPVAAGDMAGAASQDCKACKCCDLLSHWDFRACQRGSYYQKVLKWGDTYFFLPVLGSPGQAACIQLPQQEIRCA